MSDDRPSVHDATKLDYIHEEALAKPAAPSSNEFVVRLTASGVVGQGTAPSTPATEED